jgi:hypothetical protein
LTSVQSGFSWFFNLGGPVLVSVLSILDKRPDWTGLPSTIGRVGHTEISLGRSEPAKKVQTSGEWTSAWNATIKAVKFAFPNREQELREYGEYIEGHFSAKVVSAHRRIILFDIAIRNEVGGGQNALLTDTHRFSTSVKLQVRLWQLSPLLKA